MRARTLHEKLAIIERQQGPLSVNSEFEKNDWIAAVESLYDEIESYLADLVDSGRITVERSTLDVHDERFGVYTAPVLNIDIGNQAFVFCPRGHRTFGSDGRVDLFEIGDYKHQMTLRYQAPGEGRPAQWQFTDNTGWSEGPAFSCAVLDALLGDWLKV